MPNYIAIDLGASSGRVMLGRIDQSGETPRVELQELHRFENGPVQVRGHMYWDVLRLWTEILRGMRRYTTGFEEPLAGIGIDTWAVDFGLLDRDGQLIGYPFHYRDHRTEGVPEAVDRTIPPQRLFGRTGVQRLPLNTLYQLASMRMVNSSQFDQARTLLLIPDLFHYWMTGEIATEYTNASTTQCFDVLNAHWATDVLDDLGIPSAIFSRVIQPGTVLGHLLPEVCDAIGLPGDSSVPVVAVATHDTASAIAATPGLDARSAYISSGTWSLVGIEATVPILSVDARLLNFTNEGGVAGTTRFLRNVAGLWLLQECQRIWAQEGTNLSWDTMETLAAGEEPMRSVVDPDAPDFLHPPDMPSAIQGFCRRTGLPVPMTPGSIVRCCLDSLALRYRWVLEALEHVANRRIDTVRVVGGGSQNRLLNQLTADVSGRRVIAGPVEATALGNVVLQAIGTGVLPNVEAGRQVIAASVEQAVFEPAVSDRYDDAFDRFMQLAGRPQ